MSLEDFTIETFSGRIRDRFRISVDESNVLETELIDVVAFDSPPDASHGRVPFSIVFRGPREPILPQRIYRFEHETLGAFDLFIVPIGPDDAGMQYEAVFT
jgi:hypothetical protein